ncbi:hypothetical protein GCM10025759_18840 [Lysobacter panacisoli]|uniref:Uncharacterized protein n=1 Tax=Lysobacter panacisoli TaxID=1255263 RepID=A0ABP9LBX5_9GAMM
MVPGPLYPLSQINDLAKVCKVVFSENAEDDYQALGFSLAQACDCIAHICGSEYRASLRYDRNGVIFSWDDYVTTYRGPNGLTTLYVKLRIPSPSVVGHVYCTSFHPPKVAP